MCQFKYIARLSLYMICYCYMWAGLAFGFEPPEAYISGGQRYRVDKVLSTIGLSTILKATREFDGMSVVLRLSADERMFHIYNVLPNRRVLWIKAKGGERADQFLHPHYAGVGYRSDSPEVVHYISVIEYSEWPTVASVKDDKVHPEFVFQGLTPEPGQTLSNLERIKAFVIEMVETVIFMAEEGFVLGDIKPHNVMFKFEKNRLKIRLFDFDSVTDIGDIDNKSHTFMSASDLSRSLVVGANPMMDIYAIGVSATDLLEAIEIPADHLVDPRISKLHNELTSFISYALEDRSFERWKNLQAFNAYHEWFDQDAIVEYLAPKTGSFFRALWHTTLDLCYVTRDVWKQFTGANNLLH